MDLFYLEVFLLVLSTMVLLFVKMIGETAFYGIRKKIGTQGKRRRNKPSFKVIKKITSY